MNTTLTPMITSHGLQAVFNAQSTGLQATLVEIALGDGGWTPDDTATALQNEKRRIAVRGERVNESQIHLTGVEDGTDLAYWVREIGFYLADGTLLAIWSDADQALAYKSTGVDLLLSFDLVLSALPAQSVTVDGSAGFSLPPATQSKRGLIRIATAAEASDKSASEVAVTPVHLAEQKQQIRQEIGLHNDHGVVKDVNGVVLLGPLVQYKIYRDLSRDEQSAYSSSTPLFISLQIAFTPKFADSRLVVRASGTFYMGWSTLKTEGFGMHIQLYDGDHLINGVMGFLYNYGHTQTIYDNPNLVHVDDRGGTATRHYRLALLRRYSQDAIHVGYNQEKGTGTISVEEYRI